MARQAGFWDYDEHLARLTKGGDPLVTLAEVVDFEPFRYRLEKAEALGWGEGRQTAL